jgi:predicted permease
VTEILAITGPIYLAIALGYGLTRAGLFARSDMRIFGQYVIKLALPCLLFGALSKRNIGEILNPSYLLAYLGGTLAMIGLGLLWGRQRGLGASHSAVAAMGMACSNSSFIGYPILLLTVAPVAAVALSLNTIVENVLVIPLLLVLAERGRGQPVHWLLALRQTLWRLAGNPFILALLAGLLVALLGWHLPAPLTRTIDLFAQSSAALSLFVIGGTLVGLPMQGMGRQVLPIVVAKLTLHPLAVYLATLALPLVGLPALSPALQTAAVLLAAMPMMSIYPILIQRYGKEDLGAAALLLATVLSFVSLSALLWLIQSA